MPHILVIEDDSAIRDVISRSLVLAGCSVTSIDDSSLALQCLSSRRPDAIITDIFVGATDGISAIIELQRSNPHIPILAISGGGEIGHLSVLKVAQALGAHAVLPKPFGREELLGALEALLALRPEPRPSSPQPTTGAATAVRS